MPGRMVRLAGPERDLRFLLGRVKRPDWRVTEGLGAGGGRGGDHGAPVSGVVDLDQERQRLGKEIARADDEIRRFD